MNILKRFLPSSLISVLLLCPMLGFGQTDSLSYVQKEMKSPVGAMLRSAVLPGWGQIYTESYIKAPIIFGIFAGLTGSVIYRHDQYAEYRDKYRNAVANPVFGPDGKTPTTTYERNTRLYKLYREFYRDERDRLVFYMGIAYLLNIADAYVDAHLFDFDVDGPLGIPSPQASLTPGMNWRDATPMLTLTLTF